MPDKETTISITKLETPFTLGMIFKWASIGGLTISSILTIIWFIADLRQQNSNLQIAETSYNEESHAAIDSLDRRINKLEFTSSQEIKTQLDIAIAILDRVDKKVAHQ
jgi:hypothetical protein